MGHNTSRYAHDHSTAPLHASQALPRSTLKPCATASPDKKADLVPLRVAVVLPSARHPIAADDVDAACLTSTLSSRTLRKLPRTPSRSFYKSRCLFPDSAVMLYGNVHAFKWSATWAWRAQRRGKRQIREILGASFYIGSCS